MLLTVVKEYPGLPDFRTLRMSEIKFFYDALKPDLKEREKLNGK